MKEIVAYTGDSPREDGKNGGDSRSICGLCTQWYVIKCVCVGDSRGRDCCVELSVRAVKRKRKMGPRKNRRFLSWKRGWVVMQ